MNAILAVDPDPAILGLFRDALEPEGYRIAVASSMAEAVPILLYDRFDVLLLDHRALLQWIQSVGSIDPLRQLSHFAPIVCLSTSVVLESPAPPSGVQRLMPKPFDLMELYATLESVLGSPAAA